MLTPSTITIGIIAAIFLGIAKTGVPGMGMFASLLMIGAFQGHEMFASGAVVPLLILGDIAAVYYYRKDRQPGMIQRLYPPMAAGLLLGTVVICLVDNSQFKLGVGILAISILFFEFLRKQLGWTAVAQTSLFRNSCGVLTGLTTMLGNAAGVISAVYFASQNLDKKRFMGTNAVFFLLVNSSKIPLLILATGIKGMLGFNPSDAQIVTPTTFLLTLILAPGLILGALLGRKLYFLIPEKIFVPLILLLNLLTALQILVTALL
ncbi:MAG: sulfite exporter TauE/SafE family protein [Thermoguttaceae bacterium]|nr:sulfite exporter TauE/SafE family protein [Thermoguttaceae bacterium]